MSQFFIENVTLAYNIHTSSCVLQVISRLVEHYLRINVMQMVAVLFCLWQGKKSVQPGWTQVVFLDKCSLLHLQLVEFTNIDCEDTEDCSASTSRLDWEIRAARNFSSSLAWHHQSLGLGNLWLYTNLKWRFLMVPVQFCTSWYRLAWRLASIEMENFTHSRRMSKVSKHSHDLRKEFAYGFFSNSTLPLPLQFKHFGKLARVPFSVCKGAIHCG